MAKQGVLARPDYLRQSRVALGALDLAQFPVGGVEFLCKRTISITAALNSKR